VEASWIKFFRCINTRWAHYRNFGFELESWRVRNSNSDGLAVNLQIAEMLLSIEVAWRNRALFINRQSGLVVRIYEKYKSDSLPMLPSDSCMFSGVVFSL
jgi:hypothetical protein